MFVTRARYDALHARYVEVLHERDIARRDAVTNLHAAVTVSQAVTTDDTVARLRADLAAARRRADRLQAAYDHAVGLDSPALDLGAHWQSRRSDKPGVTAADIITAAGGTP